MTGIGDGIDSREGYVVQDTTVEGRGAAIRIRDYIPTATTVATPFLWIHGGGFTRGGLDQKESDAPARLLAAAGRRVRTVEYRLAPRFGLWSKVEPGPLPGRFPAAHHDVLDVADDLRRAIGGPIAMGGASAGANLAAGAVLAMRDGGHEMPSSLVLAYGVFHAQLPDNPSIERELAGPLARWLFNPNMVQQMHANYVGDDSLLTPGTAFPGGADVRGFPPTFILDAHNDRLRRSGSAFADELRAADVEVRQTVIPAMHAFLDGPRKRGFAEGMAEIRTWLETHD